MTNYCKVCKADAKQRCSGCVGVFYCSKSCQVADWKNSHKNECKPYEVKRNNKLGRFMVASRDIKAGEILFRESAVVHGPKMVSQPICLGCHKNLNKFNLYRCSSCSWPMCSKACELLQPHIEECQLMASKSYRCPLKSNPLSKQESLRDVIYSLIFPLRFLLLKLKKPKMFDDIIAQLESHVDKRIASGSYDSHKKNLVPFIQKLLGAKDFPEDLILTATAILDNNCFEIFLPMRNIEIGGLFLTSLILCHDCVPNTIHYVNYLESAENDIQRYQMTFETTVPVLKGEHLTTTYTDTLKTTLERRKHLFQTKIFKCDCKRCSDSSELLTHGSSWKCLNCTKGLIYPKNSLDWESKWQCKNCNFESSVGEIEARLKRVKINLNNLSNKSLPTLEEFIKENSNDIHHEHLLMIEVKYALCLMYGNVNGFRYKDLTEHQLERKIKLCENVLLIYDKIDPGRTNQRTNIIFELNCAKIIDCQLKYKKNLLGKSVAMALIETCYKQIKDCYNILIRESDNKSIMDKRLENIKNESFV